MLSTYKPTIAFVREMKKAGSAPQFFALSVVGFKQLVDELGADARGIGISQVMPYPWSATDADRRRISEGTSKIWRRSAEHIQRHRMLHRCQVGRRRTEGRGAESNAQEIRRRPGVAQGPRLGGINVRYSPTNHKGSTDVDLTIVAKSGRLVR